ncbi:hypothetical protein [Streptomyces jumonjinensis]|uniref:hypothetical protein n=1 Tax=Streptomyces jumonjinensis TaxID=1945 RepID=UPI003792059B
MGRQTRRLPISMSELAARSGLSVRTIERHLPDIFAMLDLAALDARGVDALDGRHFCKETRPPRLRPADSIEEHPVSDLPLVLVDEARSGQTRRGKTSALDAIRAALNAAGTPYEVTDTGHGTVTLHTRPVSRPTEEHRP